MANVAAEAANWTIAKLQGQLLAVRDNAQAAYAGMVSNRHRIATLFSNLRALPDSDTKAAALADADKISRQIAQQFIDYANFKSAWNGTIGQANSFLRSVGLNQINAGLAGPELPLVPIAIAAAVLVAVAFVAALALQNRTVGSALSLQERAYSDMIAGRITPAQYQQVSDNIDATLAAARDAAKPPGPFDLTGMLQAALPIVAIVAAVILLPRLLPSRGQS